MHDGDGGGAGGTAGTSPDDAEIAVDDSAVARGISAVVDAGDARLADYLELPDPVARRRRERDEIFIAEGPVALEKLVRSGYRVRSVLATPKQRARVEAIVGGRGIDVHVVTPDVMRSTVGFDLHRGIVAAADRRPAPSVPELLQAVTAGGAPACVAVLEGLNDPENLGAIARSARAFGIDALVLDPTCIDPYYRRVVRVSMGEVLLLPVARAESWPTDLALLDEAGFERWAMTPAPGATPLWTARVPHRLAVVFGAEGPGLSAQALDVAERRVAIPIEPSVDSINVGHAAAITFGYVSMRQGRSIM
jgi:tRNA G18 (ribose-2'-O)-methylase SpoU